MDTLFSQKPWASECDGGPHRWRLIFLLQCCRNRLSSVTVFDLWEIMSPVLHTHSLLLHSSVYIHRCSSTLFLSMLKCIFCNIFSDISDIHVYVFFFYWDLWKLKLFWWMSLAARLFLICHYCFFMLKSCWFGVEELGCSLALTSPHVCACALHNLVRSCSALRVISVFWRRVDCCGMAERSWGLSVTWPAQSHRGMERE